MIVISNSWIKRIPNKYRGYKSRSKTDPQSHEKLIEAVENGKVVPAVSIHSTPADDETQLLVRAYATLLFHNTPIFYLWQFSCFYTSKYNIIPF